MRHSVNERHYIMNYAFDLTEVEKAYIAGLIDGDGWITIQVLRRKNAPMGFVLFPKIGIALKERDVIEWIANKFRIGSSCIHSYTLGSIHQLKRARHVLHAWEVQGVWCYPILKALYPYLRVKKKVAELVMKFIELRINRWNDTYSLEELEVALEVKRHVKSGAKRSLQILIEAYTKLKQTNPQ